MCTTHAAGRRAKKARAAGSKPGVSDVVRRTRAETVRPAQQRSPKSRCSRRENSVHTEISCSRSEARGPREPRGLRRRARRVGRVLRSIVRDAGRAPVTTASRVGPSCARRADDVVSRCSCLPRPQTARPWWILAPVPGARDRRGAPSTRFARKKPRGCRGARHRRRARGGARRSRGSPRGKGCPSDGCPRCRSDG